MRHPVELKEKAIKLRQKGYSLKEISAKVGIAKSTASLWARDIRLDKKARNRLKKRGILGQYKAILSRQKKRRRILGRLRKTARRELIGKSNKKTYRLLCSILFWCEGNKNDLSYVRFTNSEPEMIKCFLHCLREGFGIDENKLRGLIHLHDYHNEERQIEYWSKISKIPKERFYKSYRKPNTGKRIKKDYPGCLAITYYDAKLAKKLWSYYKEVSNIFS
ncbi:hypothetical protein KKI19_01530 [Patescibacteria group bacterium]|nr:hypothetical protein [Patescibacteria group bacterium]